MELVRLGLGNLGKLLPLLLVDHADPGQGFYKQLAPESSRSDEAFVLRCLRCQSCIPGLILHPLLENDTLVGCCKGPRCRSYWQAGGEGQGES
jgi:hypothetical protein